MKTFYKLFTNNMLIKLCFTVLLAIVFIDANAYSYLRVQDPRGDWSRGGQGSIDKIVFEVQPKGVYIECSMHITFSANGLDFTSNDTVEVNFDFDLPEGSMVTNSYLMIEDELVQAKLLDRWTATQIYEGIVNRRRDPSILYKQWGNRYYLQIYPMKGNGTREAVITYLTPANWTKSLASVILPTDFLNSSLNKVNEITVFLKRDSEWKNPRILEIPYAGFIKVVDPTFGQCEKIVLKHSGENYSALNLGFDSPMENGLYVKTFDNNGEGYYHMAFLPAQVFEINKPKKVAFVLDYDKHMTEVTKIEIVNKLHAFLKEYFNDNDYFNLFYSDDKNLTSLSSNWIQATDREIDTKIGNLNLNNISDTSYLQASLPMVVEKLKKENDISVLLITSANNILDYEEADKLLNSLYEIKDSLPRIDIVNLMQYFYYWYDYIGLYYYGNSYFYERLAKLTKGEYLQLDWSNTFNSIMVQMFQSMDGFISSFDLHTSMDGGFCYSRYNIGGDGPVYLNKPVIQVGQYFGAFPFNVEVAALTEESVFINEVSFEKNAVNTIDASIKQAWAGNYIEFLENSNYYYKTTKEIINTSLEHNVLSYYTAFLALEPGMSYELPEEQTAGDPSVRVSSAMNSFAAEIATDATIGGDVYYEGTYKESSGDWYVDNIYTGIDYHEDGILTNKNISSFPNPFIENVSITVNLKNITDLETITAKMVNLSGQTVKVFNKAEMNFTDKQLVIEWDGLNENGMALPQGTYIFMINTVNENASVKLMKLR